MSHEDAVEAFLKEKEAEDPERFKEVCEKYPAQTRARQQIIRRREIPVGLLGLSPSRISFGVAARNNVEAVQEDESG